MRVVAVGLALAAATLAPSALAGCAAGPPAAAPSATGATAPASGSAAAGGTAPASGIAPVPCLSQLQEALFLTCLRTDVDEVWGHMLRETGRPYPSMPLTVGDELRSPDGPTDDAPDRAYFSTRTGTHFPDVYLEAVQSAHGTRSHLVLTFVMAHEVGHHVQHVLHAGERVRVNDIEAQADCYAGVWARRVADAGRLDTAEYRAAAAAELDRLSRSYEGEVESHGDTDQRVASLDKGLRSGDPATCDVGVLIWR